MDRIPLGSKYLKKSYCSSCALWWNEKPDRCPDCNRKCRQKSKDKKKEQPLLRPHIVVSPMALHENNETKIGIHDHIYDAMAMRMIWRGFE